MASSDLVLNVDAALDRVAAGGDLTPEELAQLAESPDILAAGMLADAVRRRVAGTRVTYVRVVLADAATATGDAIPESAGEIKLTGSPVSLADALQAVEAWRGRADSRAISGFSWADVSKWSGSAGGITPALTALRRAGLDAVAEVPLDLIGDVSGALASLGDAGFADVRLTISTAAPTLERARLFLQLAPLVARFPHVAAIAPLPLALNSLRPTTGYDDVKAVALARLAMPGVKHVQVDWLRYGPKLAQVALTFGADDIDNVSPGDAHPDGRRRAPIEELRRNVESAGFTAVERDGRFVPRA
jgi:aminodeoxyfutalosine synthase